MKHVVIVGGGFAGFSCALELIKTKQYKITIIESANRLGGLAYSFEHEGKDIHTGYHQILSTDKPLLSVMKELNLYDDIHWKNTKIKFLIKNKIVDLQNPIHDALLPVSMWSKAKFFFFMLECFTKKDWSPIEKYSAEEWIGKKAGKQMLDLLLAPLVDIKFGLKASEVSAAWVGSRLGSREGSSNFGCLLGKEWTKEICTAAENKLKEHGVDILYETKVTGVEEKDGQVTHVNLHSGKSIACDAVVSTVSPIILKHIVDLKDKNLDSIEYIDSISTIISTNMTPQDFYWLICINPRKFMGGVFNLTDLNPQLGNNGEIILNFFTNVTHGSPLLKKSDDELIATYKKEFKEIYGEELQINWHKINRIPYVSAKYVKGYQNPDVRTRLKNFFLAGNFRSYPSVTSTGTAIQTGWDAADIVKKDIK